VCHEVRIRNEFAGLSVDVGCAEDTGLVVLYLNDMGQDGGVICLHNVGDLGLKLVVGGTNEPLGSSDGVLCGKLGSRRGDLGYILIISM
jgi:hypothetical protein